MNLYAESSAVLAWLLDQPASAAVRDLLGKASAVVASDLTLIECDRVLLRGAAMGHLKEADSADRQAHLTATAAHWHLFRLTPDIAARARQRFPAGPIRTLDALHLASALVARSVIPGLEILSLDDRVRKAGAQLGFVVQPA